MIMLKLLDDFIYFIQYVDPKSELTVSAYRKDLEQYLEYLDNLEVLDMDEVTYEMVISYINELHMDYQPASVSRKVSAIKQFHNYLIRYNRVKYNVTNHVENKRRRISLPKAISQDDIQKLLSFEKNSPVDHLDYAILLVLFRCGLRVSECVNLQFHQIYEEEKWLRIIGKGNKERMVPIASDAYDALMNFIENYRPGFEQFKTDFVFINERGKSISRQYVHRMIQLRRKEVGLEAKISAHTLRHSLATSLLNEEVDLRMIQEILGHSDIATTQIYTHVNKDKMKQEYDKFLSDPFKKKEGD